MAPGAFAVAAAGLVAAVSRPGWAPLAAPIGLVAVAVCIVVASAAPRGGGGGGGGRRVWWSFAAASALVPLALGAARAGAAAGAGTAGRIVGYALLAGALGAFVLALAALGRPGGIDRGSVLDAAMVATAQVTVLAELVWAPLAKGGLTAVELQLVVVSATDALLLTMLAHALLTNLSLRLAAARLVVLGVLAVVGAHGALAISDGMRLWPVGPFGTPALAGALCCAAASLDPSMARLGTAASPGRGLTDVRLALLALCGLTPMVLLFGVGTTPADRPLWPLAASGFALVSLIVLRLSRALDGRDDDQRRDAALRGGLTALVVATDNPTIELAVVLAARNLLEDRGATVRMIDGARRFDGPVAVYGPGFSLPAPPELHAAARRDEQRPWLVCTAVPSSTGPDGVLVATVGRQPTAALQDAFQTLAGQLGLARERAAMAESMHRRQAEHRLAALVQNAFDVITILDPAGAIAFQSPSIAAVLGHRAEDVLHAPFRSLLDEDEAPAVEAQLARLAEGELRASTRVDCRLRNHAGDWLDVEITATNLLADPDVAGLVLNIRDVSERKALEQQLIRQAFHDPLTGLANRVLLTDRVEHALQVRRRGGPEPAVLFIDLDDFKTINDSLGHPAGDQLLVELSERLAGGLRPGDTAARMGGDEFAVLLEQAGSASSEALHEVAERLLERLAVPLVLEGTEVTPRASIGVASGAQASSASDLMRNADLAMYIAKAQGGGVVSFEPSMHDSARRRLELQAELARAVERNEFEVHYQPIVALLDHDHGAHRTHGGDRAHDRAHGRASGVDRPELDAVPGADGSVPPVMGVEALVRWNHPQRGRIAPMEFIPLAEETGLIVPLGRWILEEACRTVAAWAREGLVTSLSLTVNVSARQLQEPSLVEDVALAIAASGIDPSWLVIEITESVVMHDTSASAGWLHALKSLGVRIAIDDFGTGYSSLAYLQLFPIDVMKIDRSFVLGLGTDPKARGLVRAVINLSDSLGMVTLAEGIESAVQLRELQSLGCSLGQGFAFAEPMSSGALLNAVEDGWLRLARPGPAVWPGKGPGPGPRPAPAVVQTAAEPADPLSPRSG